MNAISRGIFLAALLCMIFCAEARAKSVTVHPMPGEGFWQISKRCKVSWVKLVAINRDRLVYPGNPNLIYTWQSFVLPQAKKVGRHVASSRNVEKCEEIQKVKTASVDVKSVEKETVSKVDIKMDVKKEAVSSNKAAFANVTTVVNAPAPAAPVKADVQKEESAAEVKPSQNLSPIETPSVLPQAEVAVAPLLPQPQSPDAVIFPDLLQGQQQPPLIQSLPPPEEVQAEKVGGVEFKPEVNKIAMEENKKTPKSEIETRLEKEVPDTVSKTELEKKTPEVKPEVKKESTKDDRSWGQMLADWMTDHWTCSNCGYEPPRYK